jgi:outer membrane lipoprotein carrier protein
MKKFTIFLIATYAHYSGATGLSSLELFVKTVKTGRSEFTQVVTAPPKSGSKDGHNDGNTDGQMVRAKTSSGSFQFVRPHWFRFDYKKPFEQTIVADGQTLWLYDADLNQVTARKQSAALGSSPAALIASAPNMAALEADFVLSDAGEQGGFQWVEAKPKSKDSALQSVRVGFRNEELAVLEMLDSFGQKSVLTFVQFKANTKQEGQSFQFKPPHGVDVIRDPL